MPVTFTDEQLGDLEELLTQLQRRVLRVTYDVEMMRDLIDRVRSDEQEGEDVG
jgi:hypothetical protein